MFQLMMENNSCYNKCRRKGNGKESGFIPNRGRLITCSRKWYLSLYCCCFFSFVYLIVCFCIFGLIKFSVKRRQFFCKIRANNENSRRISYGRVEKIVIKWPVGFGIMEFLYVSIFHSLYYCEWRLCRPDEQNQFQTEKTGWWIWIIFENIPCI